MPVGRIQYLHMGPMRFSEFLLAIGEEKLSTLLLNYQLGDEIPETAHQRLLELVRSYYFVGSKVKYANISAQDQSVTLKKDLELLVMARVVSKVVHSHCSGLPLQAEMDEKVFKLLFLDVGFSDPI